MQKATLKLPFRILLYGCLGVVLAGLGAVLTFWQDEPRLPDEKAVRNQFYQHRDELVKVVRLLNEDKAVNSVSSNGTVSTIGKDGLVQNGVEVAATPEYRQLLTAIGVKYVMIREDRLIEFTMWGSGTAISSDHFMGVRYVPKGYPSPQAGWQQTVVSSLDSKKLPQEKGEVASGLYVVTVEPEWYIYRYEYQE